MSFPIRSPRHLTGGIVILARVIDKIRLNAEGKLPPGYTVGFVPGNRSFDDRLCKFLHIDFDALAERTLQGGTDEEILDWCFVRGKRPNEEQIEVWNGFLSKRGWRDNGSPGLLKAKAAAGFEQRDDLQTYFDVIDAEEGRG
ncbi:MAG: DUF5069 domain-containing protein [Verrucomicrobiota bacterium]